MPTHLIPLLRRSPSPTIKLRLHIRPVFDILPEITDVAAQLPVRLQGEGDDGDEAEREPFPALHGAGGEVATILALEGRVFGAGELGGEGWVVVLAWCDEERRGEM